MTDLKIDIAKKCINLRKNSIFLQKIKILVAQSFIS